MITQGQPQEHPKALMNGHAISSTKKKFHKEGNPPAAAGQGKRKAAASASSTGTTLAEADLRIAKANIGDLHQQLADIASQRGELHLPRCRPRCRAHPKRAEWLAFPSLSLACSI